MRFGISTTYGGAMFVCITRGAGVSLRQHGAVPWWWLRRRANSSRDPGCSPVGGIARGRWPLELMHAAENVARWCCATSWWKRRAPHAGLAARGSC